MPFQAGGCCSRDADVVWAGLAHETPLAGSGVFPQKQVKGKMVGQSELRQTGCDGYLPRSSVSLTTTSSLTSFDT